MSVGSITGIPSTVWVMRFAVSVLLLAPGSCGGSADSARDDAVQGVAPQTSRPEDTRTLYRLAAKDIVTGSAPLALSITGCAFEAANPSC